MRPHYADRWPENTPPARVRADDAASVAEGLAEHHEAVEVEEAPRRRLRADLEIAERDLAQRQEYVEILRRKLSGELPLDYCTGCGGPCRESW